MTERGALLGGRYQLDQIIGRGGMAEVWRARDLRLERDVAVKRLRVDLASDPTFQARFRREAQSAAGLNHPNIVAVYDTGEERDTASDISVPYIVMELVEGVTLREVLRDGRKIVPERALEFTAGVLDALAYAHRAGIVHRDIKPANVMLTPNGTVKVMDFGIARAVADTSATMTQTAAVIGTAQYLSPEQARGEKVDNRSDIYSVGCLLYELLTSQPLFKGDSPVSVAYQHVREIPVPPSQIDPEITAPMDAIVLKSLAKDPRDRYQDAGEMRDDIMRAINGQAVLAGAPADQPTRVIPNDPMTTTARRGVAAPAVVASAPSPSVLPEEAMGAEVEEEPRSRKGLIALLVLAGLVLVAVAVAMFMLLNPNRTAEPSPTPTPTPTPTVSASPTPTPSPTPSPSPSVILLDVPDVVGKTEAVAINELRDANFTPDVQYEFGPDQGKVLRQDPGPGDPAEKGATVTIWVSQGIEMVAVPGLDGPVDTVTQLLKSQGFEVATDEVSPADEPKDARAGDVVRATDQNGGPVTQGQELPKGTTITLYVATGQSLVPRLTGLDAAEADKEARDAGFAGVEITEEPSTEQGVGKVFKQSPAEGEPLNRSEKIKVTVATAPDPGTGESSTPGEDENG